MVGGHDHESLPGPPPDVAAAIRRGQRLFALRLGLAWVTVLLVTVGLIWLGVVARAYVHSRAPSDLSLRLLGLLSLSLAAVGTVLAAALAVIRRRRGGRRGGRAGEHPMPAVRRARRRLPVVSPVWILVAVTAVLVVAYVGVPDSGGPVPDPGGPGPGPAAPPAAPAFQFRLLVAMAALLIGVLARAAVRRRRWARTDQVSTESRGDLPGDLRAEPHLGPVEITIEFMSDNTRTFTARVEPHFDPGVQTLQEVTR